MQGWLNQGEKQGLGSPDPSSQLFWYHQLDKSMSPAAMIRHGRIQSSRHTAQASLANAFHLQRSQALALAQGILSERRLSAPRQIASILAISTGDVGSLSLLEPLELIHKLLRGNDSNQVGPHSGDIRGGGTHRAHLTSRRVIFADRCRVVRRSGRLGRFQTFKCPFSHFNAAFGGLSSGLWEAGKIFVDEHRPLKGGRRSG